MKVINCLLTKFVTTFLTYSTSFFGNLQNENREMNQRQMLC